MERNVIDRAGHARPARWPWLCAASLLAAPALAQVDLEARLAITASATGADGVDHVEYAMSVANTGSSEGQAVKVLMRMPEEFVGPAWTCVAEGGAVCHSGTGEGSGQGDVLFDTAMPPGAAVRIALVTGVADLRDQGVWLAVETVTASDETDTADNASAVRYRRCSASAPMPGGGTPPPHPCTFLDSFE